MAELWKGKPVADQVYAETGERVEAWKRRGVAPRMDAILIEGDPASAYYAQAKKKAADRLGVAYRLHAFRADAGREQVLALIAELNADDRVHGILLELPLPDHLPSAALEAAIAPEKDIDGVVPPIFWPW